MRGRISPEEFAKFATDINEHFTELNEIDRDREKTGCCFAVITVATCGVGAIFGGLCWIMHISSKLNVRDALESCSTTFHFFSAQKAAREAALSRANGLLSVYSREIWGNRGVQMTLRQEIVGMTGGKRSHPIFKPFARFLSHYAGFSTNLLILCCRSNCRFSMPPRLPPPLVHPA